MGSTPPFPSIQVTVDDIGRVITMSLRHRLRKDPLPLPPPLCPPLHPTIQVTVDDIGRVITMSLRHRLRKDPLSNIDSGERGGEEFERVFGVPAEKTRQDVPPHGTRW